MFEPPLALASLSGEADAEWALAAADHAGAAFLGGIALDEPAREAARKLVARDRKEFLPADPLAFIDDQLQAVATDTASIRPAVNVRSTTADPIRAAAAICADYDAILEINAHCRQAELCAVGCGESLLADSSRLADYVAVAVDEGAAVSVKTRAAVDGVDLLAVAEAIETAGGDAIHIDAMDAEPVVGAVADATELFVIANNGVRDAEGVREYRRLGADAVSVGRPSRDPDGRVLGRVADAVAQHSPEVNP